MKIPQKDEKLKEAMETMNEGEAAYSFSEWFGAVYFYLTKQGKVPFEDLLHQTQRKKNVTAGYLLTLIFVLVGGLLMWQFFRLLA